MTRNAFDPFILYRAEARAARISATLEARPELGAIWRRSVALSEAVASLSMEHIGIQESDILNPALELSPAKGEPQSVRAAQTLYRVMLNPPSLSADPAKALRSVLIAARMSSLVDEDLGGRVAYPDDHEVENWERAEAHFAAAARQLLARRPPPIIGALALSQTVATILPEPLPIAQRLLFMIAEHELQRGSLAADPIIADPQRGMVRSVSASWTCLPSLALTRPGMRSWAPETPTGRAEIITRIDGSLSREVGRLGPLHAWFQRLAEEFQGKSEKSRKSDLAELMSRTPVLSAHTVTQALRITDRSARRLLTEAEDLGLLVSLAPRRAYRLWAIPELARSIRDREVVPFTRPPLDTGPAPRPRSADEVSPYQTSRSGADDDDGARVDRIMSELDAALEGLDAAMGRLTSTSKT